MPFFASPVGYLVFIGFGEAAQHANPPTVSAALSFGPLSNGTQDEKTVAVPGAVPGDVVLLGITPDAFVPTIGFQGYVSAPDVVTVRCTNIGGGSQSPSGTFKVTVIKT